MVRGSGDPPGEILTVAGRADHAELLLVERLEGRHGDDLGLLRVDLRSGRFERLLRLRASNRFDAWWIAPQPDGSYVLFASSARRSSHVAARIDPSAAHHRVLSGLVVGHGAVIAPPVVSLRGVSVAVGGRGSFRAVGYRFPPPRGRREARGCEDIF